MPYKGLVGHGKMWNDGKKERRGGRLTAPGQKQMNV